jgi:UDP-glucose 4-epimerase
MSKFLVTGGAGFIGSHLVEILLRNGHNVTVYDNLSTGNIRNLSGFCNINKLNIVKGDISNDKLLSAAMKNKDYVIHLAALVSVPESIANPAKYNKINVTGTLKALVAAQENNVKKFIFASSSAVYGEVGNAAVNESHSTEPISPYGATKLIGEYYCKLFNDIYNLPTASLRFFNVYGPRQSLSSDYASVIPKFASLMLKEEGPPIYGDGDQERDFVYVKDLVKAIKLSLYSKKANGEVFNVGSGKSYTVNSITKELNNILMTDIVPIYNKPRPGDVYCTKASVSKISKKLLYKSTTTFFEGIRKTLDYYKNESL